MIATYPSQAMAWHKLLSEAEKKAKLQLEEDLKSYLMFVLMRLMKKPEMLFGAAALDYLKSTLELGELKKQSLRDVGDKCLLLSGFFPEQTIKRRVEADYFISIGSSAYQGLSEELSTKGGAKELSGLYMLASKKFVVMMTILLSAKTLDDKKAISPLLAYELFKKTGLQFFRENFIGESGQGIITPNGDNSTKH